MLENSPLAITMERVATIVASLPEADVQTLPFHPLADLFPLIEGAEFDELVSSIKENGQRETIVTLDDQILDGRNRYRACLAAGVEPRIEAFKGSDPIKYVMDVNIHRRHLNESQRALIAAKLANLKDGVRADYANRAGVEISTPADRVERKSPEAEAAISAAKAAEMLNVDRHTVFAAKKVLAEGTEEEIKAVEQGTAAVSTIAKDIRANKSPEERASARKKKTGNGTFGSQLNIPDGMTAIDLFRKGMSLEAEGVAVEDAAKELGIGLKSYRQARDLTLLSDRDDLGPTDTAAVQEAVALLEKTKQVAKAYELVQAIVSRVWGGQGSRRSDGREAQRIEAFDKALTIIAQACEQGEEITIPQLSSEQASAATKQLKRAEVGIRALRLRIEETQK